MVSFRINTRGEVWHFPIVRRRFLVPFATCFDYLQRRRHDIAHMECEASPSALSLTHAMDRKLRDGRIVLDDFCTEAMNGKGSGACGICRPECVLICSTIMFAVSSGFNRLGLGSQDHTIPSLARAPQAVDVNHVVMNACYGSFEKGSFEKPVALDRLKEKARFVREVMPDAAGADFPFPRVGLPRLTRSTSSWWRMCDMQVARW
jgi:hypothetical protein